MLTKIQTYILGGCLLASVLFVVIHETWPLLSGSRSLQIGTAEESAERRNIAQRPGNPDSRPTGAVPDVPLPDGHFRLTVSSRNIAKHAHGEEKLDADIELKYAHQPVPGGIVVSFYSMEMKSVKDGRLSERFFMSHDKFVEQSETQVSELGREEVSPEMRERLDASFATNHSKILLDEDLNEAGRESLSTLGWLVINEGLLNTTRLVHGPYSRGANSWTSSRRIPMSNGLVLDCPVQYKKADATGSRIELVGSLTKEEVRSSSVDVAVRNVSIRLSGEEVFDRDVGDYTTGKLELAFRFDLIEEGQSTATLSGEMAITLERVVAKK